MANGKIQALEQLAQSGAMLNEKAAQQQQAAARLQFGQAAAQPQQGVSSREAAQMLAPQAQQAQAQPALAAQAATQQQAAQLGQQGLAVQAQQQQQDLGQQQLAVQSELSERQLAQAQELNKYGIDQDNRLASVSAQAQQEIAAIEKAVGTKIFESRLQFNESEAGRKLSNERQFADWTLLNAKSDQEIKLRMQQMQNEYEKQATLDQAIFNRTQQALLEEQKKDASKRNNDQIRRLQQSASDQKKAMQKKQRDAANSRAIWKGALGVGMVAAGVALSFTGVGAPVGAGIAASGVGMTAGAVAEGSQ